jgi:carbon-monoxide dehydrogenase large subunit
MGFKGAGEGGIVAVAAAVGNAVVHALNAHGIQINDLPITPNRLRAALRATGT